MKRKLLFWGLVLVLALILAACGGSATPAPKAQPSGGNETSVPASSGGEEAAPTEASPAESPAAAEPASEQPQDVPVMEGAYDLSVERSGTQMRYKVDSDVQTVVDFYHGILPSLGWEIKGPPDSVVGNIASMLRENAAGDRLSINMQYNPNAQFTVVTIAISR
ncbi:MAG: hypothetical protein D6755_04605, partial [Anaerolineae bacterium]